MSALPGHDGADSFAAVAPQSRQTPLQNMVDSEVQTEIQRRERETPLYFMQQDLDAMRSEINELTRNMNQQKNTFQGDIERLKKLNDLLLPKYRQQKVEEYTAEHSRNTRNVVMWTVRQLQKGFHGENDADAHSLHNRASSASQASF